MHNNYSTLNEVVIEFQLNIIKLTNITGILYLMLFEYRI